MAPAAAEVVVMGLLLAVTLVAAAVGRVGLLRRRRRFAGEAAKLHLRHVHGDTLGQNDRIAARLPTPGAADVRVLETLFQPGRTTQFTALVEYATRPLTAGTRRRRLIQVDPAMETAE